MGQPGSPQTTDTVVPVDATGADLSNVVVGSTAQPGLVYQPGATYTNGSTWSGNRCNNRANLLIKSRAMRGLRTIAIDLSLVGDVETWSDNAALDFGGDVLLRGVRNPANGAIPSITFDGNTRLSPSGSIETRDLAIAVASTNTAPVIALDATHRVEVIASGHSVIFAKGAYEWVTSTSTSAAMTLRDFASLPAGHGDGGTTWPAIRTNAGAYFVELLDAASVADSAIDLATTINLRSDGAFVDASFGAQINLFPGVLYTAPAPPDNIGVTPTGEGCVVLDTTGAASYYWTGSIWQALGGGSATDADIPAGTIPTLGSGSIIFSPDGTNQSDESTADKVALVSDGPVVIFTFPISLPVGARCTYVAEIDVEKDGATGFADFGTIALRISVRNVAGTLLTCTGATTPTTISDPNSLGANVAGTQATIDVTQNPPTVTVSRVPGLPMHATMLLADDLNRV